MTSNRKPFFLQSDYHFNVSHSADLIASVISDLPVGIDIEKSRKIHNGIVSRYFAKQEIDYIFKDFTGIDNRFSLIWTRREAYVKWLGGCIEELDNSFSSLSFPAIHTYLLGDYYISICSENFEDIQFIYMSN